MLFGIPEIKEYEKTCTDPYVLAIIKKLWESKSTSSKQHEYIIELEFKNRKLNDDLSDQEDIVKFAKKNN